MPWLQPEDYITGGSSRGADDPAYHGTMFMPLEPATVTQVRVWKPVQATGASGHPHYFSVWNFDTDTKLVEFDVDGLSWPDNSHDGWVSATLPDPIRLEAGTRYVVAYRVTATAYGYAFLSGAPALPAGGSSVVAAIGPPGSSASYSGHHYTTSTDTSLAAWTWLSDRREGADIFVPSTGDAATAADLTAWLSNDSGANAHQDDGLPWQTKATVDTINTSVGAGLGANVSTALTLISSVATIVTAIRDLDPVSALSTLLGNLQGASDSAATALQNLSNHALDVLNGHATTGSSTPNFAWVTAGDPVSFTTSTFLAVAADAYLLEITTPANGQALNTWNGVDVYFRAGWWCECIDGVGAERHYVDFRETWLRDGVRRLGGCLVVLQAGTEATITPYTLGPA